jgi:hypothetical protein
VRSCLWMLPTPEFILSTSEGFLMNLHDDQSVILHPKIDFYVSDHMSVICYLSLLKQPLIGKWVKYIRLCSVNIICLDGRYSLIQPILPSPLGYQWICGTFPHNSIKTVWGLVPLHRKSLQQDHVFHSFLMNSKQYINRSRRKAEKLLRKTEKESDLLQSKSIKMKQIIWCIAQNVISTQGMLEEILTTRVNSSQCCQEWSE